MSEGPARDIGADLHARGIGGPKNSKADKTNEESTPDMLADAAGHQVAGLAEHFGIDLQELGSAGIQRAFGGDTEGIAGKMIMPSILPDSQGGFFARLFAPLIRRSEITDHTLGVGGGAGIEGGHYGDGGHHHVDFSSIAGPPNSYGEFDYAPASRADLGTYSPPNIGDAGPPIIIER